MVLVSQVLIQTVMFKLLVVAKEWFKNHIWELNVINKSTAHTFRMEYN